MSRVAAGTAPLAHLFVQLVFGLIFPLDPFSSYVFCDGFFPLE
jgi:hypothetical protein